MEFLSMLLFTVLLIVVEIPVVILSFICMTVITMFQISLKYVARILRYLKKAPEKERR